MSGFFHRLKTAFRRFMTGRYGADKLNMAMVYTAFGVFVVSLLLPWPTVRLVLMLLYYGLCFGAIFRMLSRNTYKRYQENRKFLMFFQRLRDREHRYYDCPRCRQQIRVPRGKGRISITCPKCREKFIRKT